LEFRRLGRTGFRVSVLGLGAAGLGSGKLSEVETAKLIYTALDSGINCIDTAECYGDSEIHIGKALGRNNNQVFVFTKCGHSSVSKELDWTTQTITDNLNQSLVRLKREQLDLVNIHSCPREKLIEGSVIEALERAKEAGKVRHIGLSGDGKAAVLGLLSDKFDVLQTSLNIADQEAIELTLPVALEKDVGVIVKRPLANAVWRYGSKPDNSWLHTYWNRIQALNYPFLNHNDCFGLAIRFPLTHQIVSTALVGTLNKLHLKMNIDSVKLGSTLDPEIYKRIRARFLECSNGEWHGVG